MAIVCGEGGSTTQEVFDEINAKVTQADIVGAIGNINNPLLDLPLNNSLAMKQGVGSVTFTRATTATYIDRYGVLQYSAIDEPRFEKDGLLIEGGSTNLLTYSEDFSTWIQSGVISSKSSTIFSPDGINYAEEVLAVASNTTTYVSQSITVSVDTDYTLSIYLKKGNDNFAVIMAGSSDDWSPQKILYYEFDTDTISGSNLDGTESRIILSNGWVRLSLPLLKSSVHTTPYIRAYSCDNASLVRNVAAIGTEIMYMWGAQLEAIPFASSYIPTTTTAVTRSSDVCSVNYLNNMLSSSMSQTISYEFEILGIPNATLQGGACGIWGIQGDLYRYTRLNESTVTNKFLNTSGIDYALPTPNTIEKHSLTFDGTTAKAYSNGVLYRSDTTDGSSVVNGSPSTNTLYIGRTGHASQYLYGHIKNFRIWDKALTQTEVTLA